MIERYTRKEMARIWTEERKLRTWLDIEIAICEAYHELGVIPAEDLAAIREHAAVEVERVRRIEEETKHDVVAFIQAVSERVGPASKWIHLGVTSSDILDTSFSLLLREAAALLIDDITAFMAVLKEKAQAHKFTPMMGRTHGIHAEPTTFGLKMAQFHDEMRRNRERLTAARERASHGKISGAVGTYAHVPPFVEEYVCKKLGLTPAPVSTQIVPRDYYAEFFTTLAIIGSSLEKMATEISTSRGPRWVRRRSSSGRGRPALRQCRTRETRSPRRISPGLPGSCGATRSPRSRTSPCGTSGTSATRPSKG
jgi:adenylosuccinate lyase